MKKRIPIGIGDFKELIEGDFYFVDKSLLIKDIIEDGAKVILLPRPRRFGKTLNMSMIKYFFEKSEKSNLNLFNNLNVKENEEVMKEHGKYPVVFISFKDVKDRNFEKSFDKIKTLISHEYTKYRFILKSDNIDENSKKYFNNIMFKEATDGDYELSLGKLSEMLNIYYKEKTIILIDEYDVPIQSAFSGDYYDTMMEFMRNFLSAALKDNVYLKKAILTGILRVAKESIFSGLN